MKNIMGKIKEKFKGKLKLKKKGKAIFCIVLAIVVALAGVGIYKWRKTKKTAETTDSGTSIVRAGSLTNSISGSGSVEPIEQRDIVPVVKGKIIEAPFAEGDEVRQGDILYRFEMTAATNAIESAQNNVEKAQTNLSNKQSNLEKAQRNIEKLTIKATASGKIEGLTLMIGEERKDGFVCTITNYKEQSVTLPFAASKIDNIKVGDSVSVAVDKYMINTSGKVARKYTTTETLSNGAVVYNVEISLDDTYILEEGVRVTATVNGISSATYGNVKYADPVTINASQRGEVKKVNFKNGDWVDKGEVIAVLQNDDLKDELKNAQQSVKEAEMNLTEAQNNLEDKLEEANEYIVESPIDGVVLTKDYEVGDTISGQNSTVMMVVADMSRMKFTISADELDISKIALGQNVSVTADALTGQRLSGRITAISKLGTSSNGVTNYPIEVTIDNPGDLMPGMNVSANIIVEQVYDALYLPVEAVEYYGGKYYVTIVGEVENMPERPKMPTGGFGMGGGNFGGKQGGNFDRSQAPNSTQAPNGGNFDRSQAPNGGQAPSGGNFDRSQMPNGAQRPEGGNFDRSQMPGGGQRTDGSSWGERPSGASAPANTQTENKETKTEVKTENKEQTKKEDTKTSSDKKTDEKAQSGTEKGSPQQGGKQQEEYKIKKYAEEKRVEVEIGIITDTYYEIKSGVQYGQVVKNTTQTSSSNNRFGMGGGMMGGGMPSGGMGGNRNSGMGGNRNSGMGGNRSSGMGGR